MSQIPQVQKKLRRLKTVTYQLKYLKETKAEWIQRIVTLQHDLDQLNQLIHDLEHPPTKRPTSIGEGLLSIATGDFLRKDTDE